MNRLACGKACVSRTCPFSVGGFCADVKPCENRITPSDAGDHKLMYAADDIAEAEGGAE